MVAATRKQDRSCPPGPLLHLNQLLLFACRLACGVRALCSEPGVSLLKCFCLCVNCCPANVRVPARISVNLNAFGPHCGSRSPKISFNSVLPPVPPWHLTISGYGACCTPLSTCLILFRPPPSLIVACAIISARTYPLPGRPPWHRSLLRKTLLPGSISVDLSCQPISTRFGTASTCAPLRCRSFTLALLWCSLSSVSFLASSLTATLWTGTLFPCMV
jgi:hypothetical protein